MRKISLVAKLRRNACKQCATSRQMQRNEEAIGLVDGACIDVAEAKMRLLYLMSPSGVSALRGVGACNWCPVSACWAWNVPCYSQITHCVVLTWKIPKPWVTCCCRPPAGVASQSVDDTGFFAVHLPLKDPPVRSGVI